MITPCPNPNPDCPFYGKRPPKRLEGEQSHGCYADTDHVIPRFVGRQATSKLVKNYVRSKANQQQLCRWEHEEKTRADEINPPEIPPERVMIDAIKSLRKRRAPLD